MAQQNFSHIGGPLIDRSGTIATGGTAQALMPYNARRSYLIVQNHHATADLWVDFGLVAVGGQPSIRIPAGADLVFETNFVPTNSVSIFGGTTGQAFTAKEG